MAKIESNYCGSSLYKNLPYVNAYDSAHWNNLKPDLIEKDSTIIYNTPITNTYNYYSEENKNIKIFPNPTKGEFDIVSNKKQIVNIEIINVSSEVVLSKQVYSLQVKMDITRFVKGIYFVKIQTDDGNIKTLKIVKE